MHSASCAREFLVHSSRYLRCWCDSSEAVEMILAHCQWCNIILCWFPDNTAGIVTRRSGFQRRLQDAYVLPVVVEDSGYPAQSSTSTLTIRVCSCGAGGSLLTCSAEAIFLPVGLSTGALMAILLCVALLIGKHIFLLSSCFFYNSERNIKTLFIAPKPAHESIHLTCFGLHRFCFRLCFVIYKHFFRVAVTGYGDITFGSEINLKLNALYA